MSNLPILIQLLIVWVIIFVIGMVFNWLFPMPPEPPKRKEMTEEERNKIVKDYYEKKYGVHSKIKNRMGEIKAQAEEFREIHRLYYDSLKSRDKSESVDLGKKYYGYDIKINGYKYKQGGHTYLSFTPSISQEQLILLQIQTDILAHS